MADAALPPKANLGKEYAVLICLLRDPWLMISSDLKSHNFQIAQARTVFTVLEALKAKYLKGRNSGGPGPDFSPVTVKSFAKECQVGIDHDVLQSLYDRLSDEREFNQTQFPSYVESVKNASLTAKLLAVTEEIGQMAMKHNIEEDVVPLIHKAENKILALENEVVSVNEPVRLFDPTLVDKQIEEYREQAAQGK
jgi:replicative DNA helicase